MNEHYTSNLATRIRDGASLEQVKKFIENAENKNECVTAKTLRDETALHIAAREGDVNILRLLIDNAEDKNKYVTAKNWTHQTALHIAVEFCHADMVRLLIENADDKDKYVTAGGRYNETALHLAAEKGDVDTVCLLLENANDKNEYVTARTSYNATALHLAAKRGDVDTVRQLLDVAEDKREYISARDQRGKTAFLIAVAADNGGTVSFLLENGAKVTEEGWGEETVWDLAVPEKGNEGEVIADFILREEVENQRVKQLRWGFGKWETIDGNSMALINMLLGLIARLISQECPGNRDEGTKKSIPTLMCILGQVRREFHESQEAPQHLRYREPLCIFQTLKYSECKQVGSKDFVSLVLPFIFIDELLTIEERKTSRINVKSLKYCNSETGKWLENHIAHTLDEYCHPALPQDVLEFRNHDQVLSRHEKKRQQRGNATQTLPNDIDGGHPFEFLGELWIFAWAYLRKLGYLIDLGTWKMPEGHRQKRTVANKDLSPTSAVFIHQTWIWKIDNRVIATLPLEMKYDLHSKGIFEKDGHVGIAFVLMYLVELFDKPSGRTHTSLLKIYENELSIISEEVNWYMKSVLVEDIDIDQEKAFFHEISDLREELSMIKSVLAEQEEVWEEFMSTAWPHQEQRQQQGYQSYAKETERGVPQIPGGFKNEAEWNAVWRPRVLFNKYRRRIAKLEEDAERVERNISTQLDLKQKHAALKEAHSTAIAGAMVFGFTIVTVIFAPLSFVAALFALPIDKFNEGKAGNQQEGVYSSNYVGKWSAATVLISVAVTLLAMWAGLQFAGLHVWGKKGLRAYIRQKANAILAEERNAGEKSTVVEDRGYEDTDKDMEDEDTEEGSTQERNKEEGEREGSVGYRAKSKRLMERWGTLFKGNKTADVERGYLKT